MPVANPAVRGKCARSGWGLAHKTGMRVGPVALDETPQQLSDVIPFLSKPRQLGTSALGIDLHPSAGGRTAGR